jgi:hypothetical protein
MPVSKHPLYAKFFRLLQLGAPMVQLRQNMIAEGLNPDYLE